MSRVCLCHLGRSEALGERSPQPLSDSLLLPGGSEGKNPPAMQKTQVQSLGQEDPLEEEMATHCNTRAWGIPWTEAPGRLPSTVSQSQTRLSTSAPPSVTRVSAVTLGMCLQLQGTRASQQPSWLSGHWLAFSGRLSQLCFSFPVLALCGPTRIRPQTILLITVVTKCRCRQLPGHQALRLLRIPAQAMAVRIWETQRPPCCLTPWPFAPGGYLWAPQICEQTQSQDSPSRVSFLVCSGSNTACANMSLLINGLCSCM